MKFFCSLLLICLWSSLALAAEPLSPAGLWQTVDDDTGKVRSIVELKIVEGELQGQIVELIDPAQDNPVCDKCKSDKHNQPIVGLTFLWGLAPDQSDDLVWEGGRILDPENGKIYSAKLQLRAQGTELEVRGYLGFALMGRSQIWYRQSHKEAP